MNKLTTNLRLQQQLAFLVEIDKLKYILRKTRLIAGPQQESRYENSAEHSWHITLLAMTLAEYTNEPIDLLHVVKMLMIHDLVEIDAGDTFAFADQSGKAERELLAAQRIFGLLPQEQQAEFFALWQEFEARQSAEACFANAMDRLMPVLHNINTQGGSWADHGVTRRQVNARLSPIGDGSVTLWEVVKELLDEAERKGYVLP